MNRSKITFLLCTYNRLIYLKKIFPKIIKDAKINNCQMLIINNGSTDGTTQYLNNFKKKYNFITCFKKKNNVSAVKNYKLLIGRVKTKYFMLIGDHYRIYGDYVKKAISILDNYKNVSIVHHYFSNNLNKKINFHKKGNNAKKIIFNLSGSMTGLTFRNEKNLKSKFLTTNNKIYPQIDLCMYLANNADIALLNNAGFLPTHRLHPNEIAQLAANKIKINKKNKISSNNIIWRDRPVDFGLNERVQIAKKNFNLLTLLDACNGLFSWHMDFFNQISDPKMKNKYTQEILKIFNIYCFHNSLIINIKNLNLKNFTLSILHLLNFKTLICLIINTILYSKNFFVKLFYFLNKIYK
jgi:hypothetical protein